MSPQEKEAIAARNPLSIPPGEKLPPLEEILEAARREAINLRSGSRVVSRAPEQDLDNPTFVFAGTETRHLSVLRRAISERLRSSHHHTLRNVLELLGKEKPTILVVDSSFDVADAFELVQRTRRTFSRMPIVFVLRTEDPREVMEAFRAGANDVLVEPVSPRELAETLKEQIRRQRSVQQERSERAQLENIITERTSTLIGYMEALKKQTGDLENAYRDVVVRLRRAAQWRDDETGEHTKRIGLFSGAVARRMGLANEDVILIEAAAPLHDIGKIGVPDSILLKPGRLTAFEFDFMKRHTIIGAEILAGSQDPILFHAEEIALSHHEWYNGNGYPYEARGAEIPLFARIVSIVDVFDALTHRRVYKKAMPLDQSIETMGRRRGTQFDPDLFDVFYDTVDELVKIEKEMGTSGRAETKYSDYFGIQAMTAHLEETWVDRGTRH